MAALAGVEPKSSAEMTPSDFSELQAMSEATNG
jgi:hypothetical protein